MQEGIIANLKSEGGYGFIKIEGAEKELFFHASALQGVSFDELNTGDKVTFEVEQGEKGPHAVNVSRV
ncbi:cold shock domain-containing protein [Patescibacteria group bacterium]|jgi:CspA family cold shock protein|nr:cold shock domain-containing protein [Patescibacteria group bacterium]